MALLKYNGNLISTSFGLLEYTQSTPPTLTYGGWKHKDTGVWTGFSELYPHYGDTGGIIDFNGFSTIEPESVGNVAHNISELVLREGCNYVENIGLMENPDTQEMMYEYLSIIDLPSTIQQIGKADGSIFDGLANVTELKIRALTPPGLALGTIQSPNVGIYVPDAVVNTYKTTAPWSTFAAIVFPLSDVE